MNTIDEFKSHASFKGFDFSIKDWGDGTYTWKLKSPDGRIFGRYVCVMAEEKKTKLIIDGGMATIRCVKENKFPCEKVGSVA